MLSATAHCGRAATTPHHLARNHMAPAPARCEPIPAFLLPPGQSRLRTCPWNIRRRVEHRGAHQGRFHSPHRFSEARVRRKGSGAHGPTSPNPYDTENGPVAYARHITSPVTALVGVAERQQVETGGGSTYRQEQASANKDTRRCNQRQVTNAGRNGHTEREQASASKDKRRCNQRQVTNAGEDKRERDRRSRSKRQQARTSAGVIRDRRQAQAGTSGNGKQAETGKCRQAPFYAEHTTRRAGQAASPPNARKPSRKVKRLPLCR